MSPETRVTIGEIARRLGISKATVSNALNGKAEQRLVAEETARQVIDLARELGYVPNGIARSLRKRRSGIIGVLLSDIAWNWSAQVFSGLEGVFDDAGLLPIFAVHGWNSERLQREVNSMVERRVDGIIISNPPAGAAEIYAYLTKIGMPLVFLNDRPVTFPQANAVVWDSPEAIRAMVRLLLERGRRRIGYAGINYELLENNRRAEVFREEMQRSGQACPTEHVVIGDLNDALEKRFLREFLRTQVLETETPLDAIVCMHDQIANAVLTQLIDAGIAVPRQVALTGIGCFPATGYKGIGVTSAEEPTAEMGSAAGRLLIQLIEQPDQPPRVEYLRHLGLSELESTPPATPPPGQR